MDGAASAALSFSILKESKMARNADNNETPPVAEPVVTQKTISLTVDHVFMPVCLVRDDIHWFEAETKRYSAKDADGRRVKYSVHAELADLLISKDQAMEVPD